MSRGFGARGVLIGFFLGMWISTPIAYGKPVPDFPSSSRGKGPTQVAEVNRETPYYPQNLWLLQRGYLNRVDVDSEGVLQRVPVKNADAMAVQPSDGTIWYASNIGISSLTLDGEPLLADTIPLPNGEKVRALAVDDANGLLWASTDSGLHRLSIDGRYLQFIPLENISAGPVMSHRDGRVWLLVDDELRAFEADGRQLGVMNVSGLRGLRALSATQDGQGIWLAGQHKVVGLRSDGSIAAGPWQHQLNSPSLLAGDGTGGVWVANAKDLSHFDAEGRNTLAARPIQDGLLPRGTGGAIRLVAPDRRDGSLWFALNHSAYKLNANGALVASVDLERRGGAVASGLLHIDDTPPEIWINTPDPEIYTNDNTPEIGVAYTDFGSRVTTDTLAFTLNEQSFEVDCERREDSADCVPKLAFEDGYHTLTATIGDLAENVSAPDSVRFTVDTIPPTITVRSPEKVLYTNQPLLEIDGEINEFAYLKMNGKELAIDADFQFTTERLLEEGENPFHFRAEDRATNWSELTRKPVLDTLPPELTIDTPVEALSTAERTIVVSGSVDEPGAVYVAGNQVAVDTEGRFAYEIALTEGNNAITVIAEDRAGNRTSTVRSVTYDTVPPGALDSALISMSAVDEEGYATITGLPGSTEPGGYVEIYVYENEEGVRAFSFGGEPDDPRGTLIRIPVNDDGSFSGRIFVGHDREANVDIVLVDAAGNRGETISVNTRDMLDHSETMVGAIKGEFSVDATGAANFRIPISVPTGAAGMQPDLALLYSSRAGNGHLGVGWSLSGLSAVTRCPQTQAQDQNTRGVTFDSTDRFCLDGQRLMPVSGGDYYTPGKQYYTEIASFQRITAFGGSSENGPKYFKVEDKSGLYRYYGEPVDGAPDARIELEDSNVAQLWGVSRIEDRYRNHIDFEYVATGREYWPRRIRWYNNSGTRLGEAAFTFTNDRADSTTGYLAGGYRSELSRRMSSIAIRVRSMEGRWIDVGKYHLSYRYGVRTGNSRLDSIHYCAESGECVPKTLFNYTDFELKHGDERNLFGISLPKEAVFADLNKDGRVDPVYRYQGKVFVRLEKSGAKGSSIELADELQSLLSFVDADGDGYLDLIAPKPVDHWDSLVKWEIHRWLPDQERFSNEVFDVLPSTHKAGGQLIPIDIDMDGRQEILVKKYFPQEEKQVLIVKYFDGRPQYNTSFVIEPNQNIYVIEANADGLPDVFVDRVECHIRDVDSGGGTTSGSDGEPSDIDPPEPERMPETTCYQSAGLLENVDGRFVDPVIGDPWDGWVPELPDGGDGDSGGGGGSGGGNPPGGGGGGGGGWCDPDTRICHDPQFAPISLSQSDYGKEFVSDHVFPIDANNDGLTDFIHYDDQDRDWELAINYGKGWRRRWKGALFGALDNEGLKAVQVGDIDADGYADLALLTVVAGQKRYYVAKNDRGERFRLGGSIEYVKDSTRLLDVNSDGLLDILRKRSNWMAQLREGGGADLLYSSIDGYGEQTDIRYGSLANHRVFGEPVYLGRLDADEAGKHQEGHLQDFMGPLIVVAGFSVDTGTDSGLLTRYSYRGARVDVKGRGFVGFREVTALNENSAIQTVNRHRLAFPFTGMVMESRQEIPASGVTRVPRDFIEDFVSGKCVTASWNCSERDAPKAYALNSATGSDAQLVTHTKSSFSKINYNRDSYRANGMFVFAEKVVKDTYEVNGGDLITREITTYQYGDFGNVTRVSATTEGADGADPYTVVTDNLYSADNVQTWCLGRLTNATVVHTFNNDQATRSSSFEYGSGSRCLLKRETIEPKSNDPLQTLLTEYQRDEFGNVKQKILKGLVADSENGERLEVNQYDPTGRFVTIRRNSLGHEERIDWDARFGVKTRAIGPNQLPTSWRHDALGRVIEEVAATGATTRFNRAWCGKSGCESKNAAYRIVKTRPDGTVSHTFFDRLQREIGGWTTDIAGKKLGADKVYDLRGRLIAESTPMYLSHHQRCWIYVEYDNLDREVARYAPASEGACDSRSTGLPSLEDVQSVYAGPPANYVVTRAVHDGLTTYSQAANGRVQSRSLYPNGWVRKVAERVGRSPISNTSKPGNLVLDGNSMVTRFRYDAQGNTRLVVDPKGNVVKLDYDLRGRKLTMNDPDMGMWSYRHNAFGELIEQTDAKGQQVEMRYDELGRMVHRSEPEGDTDWIYDSAPGKGIGKLHFVRAPNGYYKANAYDALSNLARMVVVNDGLAWWTEWEYDSLNRVTRVHYPSLTAHSMPEGDLPSLAGVDEVSAFTVSYDYDHGRLKSVKDSNGSELWRLGQLDAAGHVTKALLGNGLDERHFYNLAQGTARNIQVVDGYVARFSESYEWDESGNLKRRTESTIGMNERYEYDVLDRLKTVTTTFSSSSFLNSEIVARHRYDAIGNLKEKGASATGYEYGEADGKRPHAVKKVAVNGANRSYDYDENGNLDYGGSRDVDWTSFNKPSRISRGSAWSEFAYGPDRGRYRHTSDDGTLRTVARYIGSLYERIEQKGEVLHRFNIRAGEQVIAVKEIVTDNGSATILRQALNYLHRDQLGSVRLITSSERDKLNGRIKTVETLDYDPWGARRDLSVVVDATGDSDGAGLLWANYVPAWHQFHRGFTGHEMLDHLGLIHMNGRVYDPDIGRFLSADPFVQFPQSTQGYNRYSYAGNNPMSYTDPSGYFNLKKEVGRALVNVAPFLNAIPVCVVWCAALATAVGGYLLTDSWEAGFNAGVMALAGSGMAYGAQGISNIYLRAFTMGMIGGTFSTVGGGRFGDGFLGAMAGSFAGSVAPTGNLPTDMVVGAIVGGTVSEIGGGSFANGAISGAMAAAFGSMTRGRTNHFLQDKNGHGDPNIDPSYGEGGVLEENLNLGGIRVASLAADSQENLNKAKALITSLAETEGAARIITGQENGAPALHILVNSGATSSSGGFNYSFTDAANANSYVFVNMRSSMGIRLLDGTLGTANWQRIMAHEIVHGVFPGMSGYSTISLTNQMQSAWGDTIGRNPWCHSSNYGPGCSF